MCTNHPAECAKFPDGYTLSGTYFVCKVEEDIYNLRFNLTFTTADDFSVWDKWNVNAEDEGFKMGWGLSYEGEKKVGAYIAHYQKTGNPAEWSWNTMGVTAPVSLAETVASPGTAFENPTPDVPTVWKPISQVANEAQRSFTVSAQRDFHHSDPMRLLEEGNTREWTACFFSR